MKTEYQTIIKPIITEETMDLASDKKYVFQVAKEANKTEVRQAVEKIFGVDVESVNTMNYDGKEKRMGATSGTRPAWKKAIVTVTEKSKTIEFFESMI